jgi:hypothetical protein
MPRIEKAIWNHIPDREKIPILICDNAYFIWQDRIAHNLPGSHDTDRAYAEAFVRRKWSQLFGPTLVASFGHPQWFTMSTREQINHLVSQNAYFISNDRRSNNLPGSMESDWAYAEAFVRRNWWWLYQSNENATMYATGTFN